MQKTGGEKESTDHGLYEVGFLLLPTVGEGEASGEASKIGDILSKHGAVIKATENPSLKNLAYTMEVHSSGKNYRHDSAYFGSVTFEVAQEVISVIQDEVEKLPNMLRVLVIKSEPEALMPRERKVTGKIEPEKFRPVEKVAPAPISDAELDKTIEEMVAE